LLEFWFIPHSYLQTIEESESIKAIMSGQRLSSSSFTYDVFLSFNPSDTRDDFTTNLFKALSEKGIKTFDEESQNHTGTCHCNRKVPDFHFPTTLSGFHFQNI